MNWILIDGSYFIFYRYYALLQWWKNARKDVPLENPIENEEFVEKFKKTFLSKIEEIPKKLKIKDPIILIGKDCPRQEIWRMDYFKDYKATRDKDDSFLGGPFFKLAYEELFPKMNTILEYPNLEADDCIALFVEHLKEKKPEDTIYIIASDHDYLQLREKEINEIK